jgi:hypothetical protein
LENALRAKITPSAAVYSTVRTTVALPNAAMALRVALMATAGQTFVTTDGAAGLSPTALLVLFSLATENAQVLFATSVNALRACKALKPRRVGKDSIARPSPRDVHPKNSTKNAATQTTNA